MLCHVEYISKSELDFSNMFKFNFNSPDNMIDYYLETFDDYIKLYKVVHGEDVVAVLHALDEFFVVFSKASWNMKHTCYDSVSDIDDRFFTAENSEELKDRCYKYYQNEQRSFKRIKCVDDYSVYAGYDKNGDVFVFPIVYDIVNDNFRVYHTMYFTIPFGIMYNIMNAYVKLSEK